MFLFWVSSLLFWLHWNPVAAEPSGRGMNGARPAFGKVAFSMGSCALGNDDQTFIYRILDQGEETMTFSEYRNNEGYCDAETFRYVTYDIHNDLKLTSIQFQSVDNHCNCAGNLTRTILHVPSSTHKTDVYCFSKAHVLRNNGDFVSVLAKPSSEPSTFWLLFSTKTVDADLNERSGYNQMSRSFPSVTTGKYCDVTTLYMFETVTLLNGDLKNGAIPFSWMCTENQDQVCSWEHYEYGTCPDPRPSTDTPPSSSSPPPPSAGSLPSSSSPQQAVDKCTGSPPRCGSFGSRETCNPLVGCSWILGYSGSTGGYAFYQPTGCYGTPRQCSEFDNQKAACLRQHCHYESASSGNKGGGFTVPMIIVVVVVAAILVVIVLTVLVLICVCQRRRRPRQASNVATTGKVGDRAPQPEVSPHHSSKEMLHTFQTTTTAPPKNKGDIEAPVSSFTVQTLQDPSITETSEMREENVHEVLSVRAIPVVLDKSEVGLHSQVKTKIVQEEGNHEDKGTKVKKFPKHHHHHHHHHHHGKYHRRHHDG